MSMLLAPVVVRAALAGAVLLFTGSSVPGPPGGLSAAEADALIAGFTWVDPINFMILAEARADPAVAAAAGRSIAAGATGDALWAATYVWVNEGADPTPLVSLVASADPAIRVMSATGLLARGRLEGFEPLFALLIDDSMRPGLPPGEVWRDATVALARYTAISEFGPPFDATQGQRQAASAKWVAWFAAHRDGLTFDEGLGLWVVN